MFWHNFRTYYSKRRRLHTPNVDVVFPEAVLRHMELQCNSDRVLYTNMPEAKHLERHLSRVKPKSILEIGGGIGRGSVYLSKRFGWSETDFYLLDGDSGDEQVAPIDGQETNAFYNSHDATRRFCGANGISTSRLHLLNAESPTWEEEVAGVRFDLVYSFMAIGFHWSIHIYLERLLAFCHPETLLFFGLRGTDRGNDFADRQLSEVSDSSYQIVANYRDSELTRSSVLVLQPKRQLQQQVA